MGIAKGAEKNYTQDTQDEPYSSRDCLAQNCPLAGAHQYGDRWVCIHHLNHSSRHWGAVTNALNRNMKIIRLMHAAIRLEPVQFSNLVETNRFNLGEFNPHAGENYYLWRGRLQAAIHERLKLTVAEAVESDASVVSNPGQVKLAAALASVMGGNLGS